jgi:uncharacterized Zn finger protein
MDAIIPGLSETLIRQHTTPDSFMRGQEYFHDGAVLSVVRRGPVLEAEVEGSLPTPYLVRVVVDGGGISLSTCTCPYDWGGWCKHIVATLFTCIHEPGAVHERPSLDRLLADLSAEQLRAILVGLVERNPDLTALIEEQVSRVGGTGPAPSEVAALPPTRRTAVDQGSIRRQVRSALHSLGRMRSSEAYWHVGAVVSEVARTLDTAWAFVQAGDGASALQVLEAITEEYVEDWTELDDSDGEASAFFEELGTAWTEAILTADLTLPERSAWAQKLEQWAAEVGDYGVDDAFDAAAAAADQGWVYPPLLQALRGEAAHGETAEEQTGDEVVIAEEDDFEDDDDFLGTTYSAEVALTTARLRVLERQGRLDEYLNLARVTGRVQDYTTMLVRRGRVAEAIDCGLRGLHLAGQALALAQTLRDVGEVAGALQVAEAGLELPGPRHQLATWLCDAASASGNAALALRAALVAVHEQPELVGYRRVRELAGDQWSVLREELLDFLGQQRTYYPRGPVEILLHEGLIAEAIALVEGLYADDLVAQVADAAVPSHPEWVIAASRGRAERIMSQGKASHYDDAVAWLARARGAYRAAAREDEWRSYLEELIVEHQRKYKLRPMLESLRG